MTNPGHFKKGSDPRRMTALKFANGESFREACREKSTDALALLDQAMHSPDETMTLRVACAKSIIEFGYGKAPSSIAIQADTAKPLDTLTLDQLDVLIARFLVDEKDITPTLEVIEHQ
jgi:hypothetical protein